MTHVARTGDGFIQRIDPPARLYVIGSWPDGRALAELALALKWAVVLIDDIREGFNLERRLSSITPDNMTAVVVMTHNLARDCVCLRAVLSRSFGYIGVIGSHTRRTALIDQLADLHDLDLLESFERVYCPAGLNLGGDGPAAVALSVLAEIQSILNGQDASCLTERNGPIHEVRSAR
jgi:xanthine/CO dehydrogenase XdhC/CoxF family maturation factor